MGRFPVKEEEGRKESCRQKGIRQLMLKTHVLAVSFQRQSRTLCPGSASALDKHHNNPTIPQQFWELRVKDDSIRPEFFLVLLVEQ